MKKGIIFLLGIRLGAGIFAAEKTVPLFSWDLLWTGSWQKKIDVPWEDVEAEDFFYPGTLNNRGDLRLGLPRLDMSFRFQALDKRVLPPEEGKEPVFTPGFGFYYNGGLGKFPGNSRLLRGVLDEHGLPSRTKNVWARSAPFAESRKPAMADLKSEPVSSYTNETYLYLGLPKWEHLTGYGTAQMDDDCNPAFGGGIETSWKASNLALEAFYTQKTLPPRGASGWFSTSPPLPERDFRFWALGAAFNTRNFGFSSDWAFSEAVAFGRDLYGSAALRFGSKPWKFSVAADAAGPRYIGRDAKVPGQGMRLAGRLERQQPRSGLFRFNSLFRASELGGAFDRGSVSLYFRPQAPQGGKAPFFRFTRFSFTLSRDARDAEKTADSAEALLGFNLRPLSAGLSGAVHYRSAPEGRKVPPLPFPPAFEEFESAKLTGDLAWNPGIFQFRTRLGRIVKTGKDPVWDFSASASLKPGKWGRVGLKAVSEDFPDKWSYTFSWRLDMYSR
ncbi:MAG: hypothetical protein LBC62_00845 [Treponema sp.]|jgi:hypothetical protein|nr:hypothetical protein [Treponema sp.]